jgi:hypothetical protein
MAFNYPIGSQGKPEKKPMAKQPSPAVAEEEPQGEEGTDSQDPHEVVAEHGPATDVHVHHEHATGQHTVESDHEDGHKHKSEHGSSGEAHQHATCLGGECSCGAM